MPANASFEDRREAPAQVAVVALARHVDEAGDEALERVAAHEQRDALALLQIEDADRGVEQLVLADLEQLVAREGVEDVRAAPCRHGWSGDSPARATMWRTLRPQQRDRARAAAVGERGEQAEEQAHPDDLAVASNRRTPIASICARAVHGGAAVRSWR